MTTPQPLSPAAQKLLDAFWVHNGGTKASLGAVLRALVENHGTPTPGGAVLLNESTISCIATELEGHHA